MHEENDSIYTKVAFLILVLHRGLLKANSGKMLGEPFHFHLQLPNFCLHLRIGVHSGSEILQLRPCNQEAKCSNDFSYKNQKELITSTTSKTVPIRILVLENARSWYNSLTC